MRIFSMYFTFISITYGSFLKIYESFLKIYEAFFKIYESFLKIHESFLKTKNGILKKRELGSYKSYDIDAPKENRFSFPFLIDFLY